MLTPKAASIWPNPPPHPIRRIGMVMSNFRQLEQIIEGCRIDINKKVRSMITSRIISHTLLKLCLLHPTYLSLLALLRRITIIISLSSPNRL